MVNFEDIKIISLENLIGFSKNLGKDKEIKKILEKFDNNDKRFKLSESYRLQNNLEKIIQDYVKEITEEKSQKFEFRGYVGFDSPDLIPKEEPNIEYVSQTFLDYLGGNNSQDTRVLGAYDPRTNTIYKRFAENLFRGGMKANQKVFKILIIRFSMVTQKNFRFRVYPSKKQINRLNQNISNCCFVYNKLLERKISAYKEDKTNLSQFDLNKITKEFNVSVHSQVLQNISKRINDAFNHFFRRVKEKKGKVGFPRFKSLNRYKSITFPQSGFKFKSDRRLTISKIGNIPIVLHRVPKGRIKNLCIKRTAIGWFAIFSCEDIPIEKIKNENGHIGIDVGIESFAILSDGTKIENPKLLIKSEKKLARLQRGLSRKKKGSANRRKARLKVARLHERIFNQRQDFLHKTSSTIVKQFKIISVEKLTIKNMVKNHYLAKSINDVSWGCFVQMLSYKVERTRGQLIKVNPKNTSRTCSKCGIIQDMSLADREFKCLKCGFVCHRDLNASLNIDRAGLVQISTPVGDTIRPSLKARIVESGTISKPMCNH